MLYRVRAITLPPAQATTYRENGMITETAVNGQAHVIVTFNMLHFGNATSRFGIQV